MATTAFPSVSPCFFHSVPMNSKRFIIELDDGKFYRKALYLMVKTHGFPVKIFPNKPIHLRFTPCSSSIPGPGWTTDFQHLEREVGGAAGDVWQLGRMGENWMWVKMEDHQWDHRWKCLISLVLTIHNFGVPNFDPYPFRTGFLNQKWIERFNEQQMDRSDRHVFFF